MNQETEEEFEWEKVRKPVDQNIVLDLTAEHPRAVKPKPTPQQLEKINTLHHIFPHLSRTKIEASLLKNFWEESDAIDQLLHETAPEEKTEEKCENVEQDPPPVKEGKEEIPNEKPELNPLNWKTNSNGFSPALEIPSSEDEEGDEDWDTDTWFSEKHEKGWEKYLDDLSPPEREEAEYLRELGKELEKAFTWDSEPAPSRFSTLKTLAMKSIIINTDIYPDLEKLSHPRLSKDLHQQMLDFADDLLLGEGEEDESQVPKPVWQGDNFEEALSKFISNDSYIQEIENLCSNDEAIAKLLQEEYLSQDLSAINNNNTNNNNNNLNHLPSQPASTNVKSIPRFKNFRDELDYYSKQFNEMIQNSDQQLQAPTFEPELVSKTSGYKGLYKPKSTEKNQGTYFSPRTFESLEAISTSNITSIAQHGSRKITGIQPIRNTVLLSAFLKKQREFAAQGKGRITIGFHGSHDQNYPNIIRVGLLVPGVGNNIGHATDQGFWGLGIYLSPSASLSLRYTRGSNKLLVCAVLLGTSFQCRQMTLGQVIRPPINSHIAPSGLEYVIPNASQVLPLYLITFSGESGSKGKPPATPPPKKNKAENRRKKFEKQAKKRH